MILNLILALIWLTLALGATFYMLLHPSGGHVALFGKDVPVIWIVLFALIMFSLRVVRFWLMRIQKREREHGKQKIRQTSHRTGELNPDFDFSDGSDKDTSTKG